MPTWPKAHTELVPFMHRSSVIEFGPARSHASSSTIVVLFVTVQKECQQLLACLPVVKVLDEVQVCLSGVGRHEKLGGREMLVNRFFQDTLQLGLVVEVVVLEFLLIQIALDFHCERKLRLGQPPFVARDREAVHAAVVKVLGADSPRHDARLQGAKRQLLTRLVGETMKRKWRLGVCVCVCQTALSHSARAARARPDSGGAGLLRPAAKTS